MRIAGTSSPPAKTTGKDHRQRMRMDYIHGPGRRREQVDEPRQLGRQSVGSGSVAPSD